MYSEKYSASKGASGRAHTIPRRKILEEKGSQEKDPRRKKTTEKPMLCYD